MSKPTVASLNAEIQSLRLHVAELTDRLAQLEARPVKHPPRAWPVERKHSADAWMAALSDKHRKALLAEYFVAHPGVRSVTAEELSAYQRALATY